MKNDSAQQSQSLMNGGEPAQQIQGDVDENGEPKKQRSPGLRGVWEWYTAAPLKRLPFAIFVIAGILTFLWLIMYLTSPFTGYLLAGLAAIIVAAYGARHFKILLALKEEVDKFGKLNNQFRAENAALSQDVDKLGKATTQLNGVKTDLNQSNVRLKENLTKFRELDANLKQMGESNLAGMQAIQEKSRAVMDQWNASLIRNEKAILNKVFDEMEMKDNDADMSKEEFTLFLNTLPEAYREKYNTLGKTFEDIAGKDNMIQYDEFKELVDVMCEEIAFEGGSR